MSFVPDSVADFLRGKRIAVAGVSRNGKEASNAIFRRLRDSGYEVVPVNPAATQVDGVRCFPNLITIPDTVDGVVIATHPRDSLGLVQQCLARNIGRVWFHRSFGQGSVSEEAVRECHTRGVRCIVGGCPLMYCEPIDPGHRCRRWWLRFRRRVPG